MRVHHQVVKFQSVMMTARILRGPSNERKIAHKCSQVLTQRGTAPSLDISISSAAPKEPEKSICPGIRLTFPAGKNQHTSYPFGLHARFPLPWNYFSEGEQFFVRSTSCRRHVAGPEPRSCKPCTELDRKNDFLHEIRGRITNGINENTPYIFFPVYSGFGRRTINSRRCDSRN